MISPSSSSTLLFSSLQWKIWITALLWTCAEVQRIWRLASEIKWGSSHQSGAVRGSVRARVSLVLSRGARERVGCRSVPGLRSKARFFPALCLRTDRQTAAACLHWILCRQQGPWRSRGALPFTLPARLSNSPFLHPIPHETRLNATLSGADVHYPAFWCVCCVSAVAGKCPAHQMCP